MFLYVGIILLRISTYVFFQLFEYTFKVQDTGTGLYDGTIVQNISTYMISTGVSVLAKVNMLILMCSLRTVYVLVKIIEFQPYSHFVEVYMRVYA